MIAPKIRQIDFRQLPISDYSRRYILRMLPHLDYYLDIYNRCIDRMVAELKKPMSEVVVVDYGGGHGFLSCLAKSRGVGKVIYIDYNPQAVEAVKAVANALNSMPDEVLQGDARTLLGYVQESGCRPDALLGMDVVEHIYNLSDFFSSLHDVNPNLWMLFTTGSTPFNPLVRKRLHHVMQLDEYGRGDRPGFYKMRRQAIAQEFPQLSDSELDMWASNTRGLNYSDTLLAVEHREPNHTTDPYNTCDPATGSWTERILPIAEYQSIVNPLGWTMAVYNGFYNTHRSGMKGLLSHLLNRLLRSIRCKRLAPFIILAVHK